MESDEDLDDCEDDDSEDSTDEDEDEDDEVLASLRKQLKEELKLRESLNKYRKGGDESVDHENKFAEVIAKLEQLRQEFSWEESNMKTSIQKIKESMHVLIKKDSPLSTFPPPMSGSIYCDLIEVGSLHCRELMDLLLYCMIPHDRPVDKRDVLTLSQAFAQVTSNLNPKKTSAMRKVRMIALKSQNITSEGLNHLSMLGLTQSQSSWHKERKRLARLDIALHKERSKDYAVNFKYDNLNIQFNSLKNDQTLIIAEYEKVGTKELPTDDSKTFEEKVAKFNQEDILLTSAKNESKKEHLEMVMMTGLAHQIGKVEGWGWIQQHFPIVYQHSHMEYSEIRSMVQFLVPLNKNENLKGDHEDILDFMTDWFLKTVEAKVEDKKQFREDLKIIRDFDDDDTTILEEAQKRMREKVDVAGEPLNWGDQLTCERQRAACEVRAGDDTDLEKLSYLRNLNFAGLMHATMTVVIHDYSALIEDEYMTEDVCSLNEIRILLKKRMITNNDDAIKNLYEKHKKFLTEIGHEFIVNAFETFVNEKLEMLEFSKEKDGAVLVLHQFMEQMGIRWMWDPKDDKFDYVDKAQEVATDIIVRTMILDAIDLIVHNGDAEGLHAAWRLLVVFFLNSQDQQRSKYAREMLLNIVTYEGRGMLMYQSCKSSNLHVPKLFYGSVWLQNSFCFQPNHYIFSEGNFSVLSSCISMLERCCLSAFVCLIL